MLAHAEARWGPKSEPRQLSGGRLLARGRLIAHAIMRIAIGAAGLRQSPTIMETRFRRIPEGPSAVTAGQSQSRHQFSAFSSHRLNDGFRTKRRRKQVGCGG